MTVLLTNCTAYGTKLRTQVEALLAVTPALLGGRTDMRK